MIGARANQFDVPCGGRRFTSARLAIQHAAMCPSCTTAQRALDATEQGPTPHTVGVRRREAEQARETLEVYARHVGDDYAEDAAGRQVARLLSALSALERALHLETRGRMGKPHANIRSVQDRVTNGAGEARE